MDSFYGGKQGVSFVIKASFESVQAMKEKFAAGANYTDVWYGEYCLIDTKNKNDRTNGQIYRRGLDYQNLETRGAEYVGQIVGPSSGTPYFQLNTIPEVKKQSTNVLGEYEYRRYPTGYQQDEEGHVIGYETSDGSDGKPIATFPFSKAHDTSLVPGKTEEGEFNDEITWTWCNIRKDNNDADSWFYVGFEIPYLVTDYQIHMTSPYDEYGNILTEAAEIERVDDKTHPFYSKWDLGIPKGVKGDSLRNLRVITPTEQLKENIYTFEQISQDTVSGETLLGTPGYDGLDDDILHKRQILVYNYCFFDRRKNPTLATKDMVLIYLGDFNIISGVELADDGTLTIKYTHDDATVYDKKIKWINHVSLSTGNGQEGGHFIVKYNNGEPDYEANLTWVKNVNIQEDGTVVYTFAGAGDEETDHITGIKRVANLLKWIKNIALNTDNGHFEVQYNNGAPAFTADLDWIKKITLDDDGTLHFWHTVNNRDEQLVNELKWVTDVSLNPANGIFIMNFNYGDPLRVQLDWVDNIYIDESTGEIIIHHVNGSVGEGGNVALDAKLKIITAATADKTGIITFHTNTGESFNIKKQGTDVDFQIKVIENVQLKTGIDDDKHIQIKYNTDNFLTPIGDPINFVQDMVVRESDFHLLVLFTDPEHRYNVDKDDPLDPNGKDKNGVRWIANVRGSDGKETGVKTYWRDYGTIKDQSGVLIGLNVTPEDIGEQDILNYLNTTYPDGLPNVGGKATSQKIVTFGGEGKTQKEFYAFDYNAYTWYYLGQIADSGLRDAKLLTNGEYNLEDIRNISVEGLAFKNIKTAGIATEDLPLYWSSSYTE